MTTEEDIVRVLNDVLGEHEARFATKSDRLMAVIVHELREIKQTSRPVNNVSNIMFDGRPLPHTSSTSPTELHPAYGFSVNPSVTLNPVSDMPGVPDILPGDEVVTRVRLSYQGDRKISVIKAIRAALGNGLKEAKDMAEADTFVVTKWQLRALAASFRRSIPGCVHMYPAT